MRMRLPIILITVCIISSVMMLCGSVSDARALDSKSDQMSQESSYTFSPGYINATRQKTDSIIQQNSPKKGLWENIADYVKNKISNKVTDDSQAKVNPELKKKASASSSSTTKSTTSILTTSSTTIMDSTQYKVAVGTGTEKVYSGDRLMSEVIDGKRHVYVGLKDVGTAKLSDALKTAQEGDMIIVGGGRYSISEYNTVKNGVMLYGGYSETLNDEGKATLVRDLENTPTTIYGTKGFTVANIDRETEINGFKIRANSFTSDGIYAYNCSDNMLTISNNEIWNAYRGIGVMDSKAIIYNNIVYNSSYGITSSQSSLSVVGNEIYNMYAAGIYDEGSKSTYSNNNVYNCQKGFEFWGYTESVADRNTISGGGSGFEIWSTDSSPTLSNNVLNGCSQSIYLVSGDNSAAKVIDNVFVWSPPADAFEYEDWWSTYTPTLSSWYSGGNNSGNASISYYLSSAIKNTYLENKGYSFNYSTTYGNISIDKVTHQTISSSITVSGDKILTPDYYASIFGYNKYQSAEKLTSEISLGSGKTIDANALATVFKGLLSSKDSILGKGDGAMDKANMEKLLNDISMNALSAPMVDISDKSAQLEAATILLKILKNPTEDQAKVLDAVQAMLDSVNESKDNAGNLEMNKASDELVKMVAAVLLTQALPDLLREGDVASIKGMFSDLSAQNSMIIFQYQQSVKPYYDEMVAELSKNMSVLQLKSIITGSMTREQLEKMPRNQIDKILDKLRNAKDRSFEEEYIVQQEAKFRKLYVDPNKKVLDARMKNMMESFTKKLSGALENAKVDRKR